MWPHSLKTLALVQRVLVLITILSLSWLGVSSGALSATASESLSTPDLARSVPIQSQARERLELIAQGMESIRLCNRLGGCRYDNITINVTPVVNVTLIDDPSSTALYQGTIDADITRPADYPDKAHYNFKFVNNHWQLLGGEEVSDVSSFSFNGDQYEVFSSYSGRTRVDKLANARSTLRIGYRALYYRVMDQGLER